MGPIFSEEKINAALRVAVQERTASSKLVPLPRGKLRGEMAARLSLSESLKVLVLNEMIKKDVSYHSLSRRLEMPAEFVRQRLDILGATDLEFLEKVAGVLGKRWFVYIA